ncbi:unnamed protein product [Calicophoron daubneyi]|uniref:CWF19-like protein 2 n=1 Tax=Calicophoron daubneyi TaxID=300641 RepID=A0AAV2T784_CALDB
MGDHRHKHRKKRKHGKSKRPSPSSSSPSSSEYEWAEENVEPKKTATKDDRKPPTTWMTGAQSLEEFVDNFGKTSEPKKGEKSVVEQQPVNELNPYWGDGGNGLPTDDKSSRTPPPAKSSLTKDNEAWLYKSYKRCLEEAKQRFLDVKELLLQRWDAATVEDMLKKFGHRGTEEERRTSLSSSSPASSISKPARWRKPVAASPVNLDDIPLPETPAMPVTTEPPERPHNPAPNLIKRSAKESRDSSPAATLGPLEQLHTSAAELTLGPQACSSTSAPTPTSESAKEPYGSAPDVEAEPPGSARSLQVRETEERLVTDDDINMMAAKVMRAELSQDQTRLKKMKYNLEKLREAKARGIKVRMHVTRRACEAHKPTASQSEPTTVLLTRMDDRGAEMPLHIPNPNSADDADRSKSKKLVTHDESGQRIAYLPEDSANKSVKDMVLEERLRVAEDVEREFVNLAAKAGRNVDGEYDDAFVSKRSRVDRAVFRLKQDAIAAHKRRIYAESRCSICVERIPRHLIISVGEKVFLSLPSHTSLVPGHCLLTPYEHIGSCTRLDSSTVEEMKKFKTQLVKMFREKMNGAGCAFLETCLYPDSPRAHTQVECIPLSTDIMGCLPGYFHKAFSELGSEWDQNRRIIMLKPNGEGACGSIPPKFPYVAVEFGVSSGGMARVIDTEGEVPWYFSREVIGGVLAKNPSHWRKPKQESFEDLRYKAVQFENWWDSYNLWSSSDMKCSPSANSGEPTPEGPLLPPEMLT